MRGTLTQKNMTSSLKQIVANISSDLGNFNVQIIE